MDPAEQQNHEAKKVFREWIDQQGHDRCWYYPDLFNRLVKIYELAPTKTPSLPPLKEFEEGCRKYQIEEYTLKK